MAADLIVDPTTAMAGTGRWFSAFLGLICLGLAVEVLLLARKGQQLSKVLARVVSEHTPQMVQPGNLIEP